MDLQAWLVIAVLLAAAFAFTRERIAIEYIAIGVLVALLLIGHLFPVMGPDSKNALSSDAMLRGFANTALLTIMALFVVGQGLVQTDAVRLVARPFMQVKPESAYISLQIFLLFSMLLSAFMNNIPQVVIAIPIIQMLAASSRIPDSKILLPMNNMIILGGMVTLLGTSTNILVMSAAKDHGLDTAPYGIFAFVVPGVILAAVGTVYSLFVMPKMLPDRTSLTAQNVADDNALYWSEFILDDITQWQSLSPDQSPFGGIDGVTLHAVHRGDALIKPQFGAFAFQAGDKLEITAKREALLAFYARYRPQNRTHFPHEGDEMAVASVMLPPASRLLNLPWAFDGFANHLGVQVVGIKRGMHADHDPHYAHLRLAAGDMVLLSGRRADLEALRARKDVLLMSGTLQALPNPRRAGLALAIFVGAIAMATAEILPLEVAAFMAATLMIATNCLTLRQAGRSLNREIYFLGASMLALGQALDVTGVFSVTVQAMTKLPFMDSPLVLVCAMFAVIAITTNLLSNNACAVLFTPLALLLGAEHNIPPAVMLATVMFAANCSFATPVGYATNLLVMGPGQYRFTDYIKTGVPLMLLMWVTFIMLAVFYYDLSL